MFKYFFIFWVFIKYKLGIIDYEAGFKEIVIFLTKVNLIFVKLCQWLTYDFCNDKIVANKLSNFIESYCEHAPYTEEDIDYESVKEISSKIKISSTPDFSGSIALCYLGEYKDKKVIVKIKRKNIEKQMKDFVSLIKYITYLLNFLYKIGIIQEQEVKSFQYLQNFVKNNFALQLNFNNECNNIKAFNNVSTDIDRVKIPSIYEHFTKDNPNVIVMDYLQSDKKKHELSLEELKFHSKNFAYISIFSLIEGNIMHADCHLGNVIFMTGNNNSSITGLIDFGLILKPNVIEQNIVFGVLDIIFEVYDPSKGQGLIYVLLTWLSQNEHTKKHSDILLDYRENYKKELLLLPQHERVETISNIMKFALLCVKRQIELPEVCIGFTAAFGSILGCSAKLNSLILEKENRNYNTDLAVKLAMDQIKEIITNEYQKY